MVGGEWCVVREDVSWVRVYGRYTIEMGGVKTV